MKKNLTNWLKTEENKNIKKLRNTFKTNKDKIELEICNNKIKHQQCNNNLTLKIVYGTCFDYLTQTNSFNIINCIAECKICKKTIMAGDLIEVINLINQN